MTDNCQYADIDFSADCDKIWLRQLIKAVTKTVKAELLQRVGGRCEPTKLTWVPIPSEPGARKVIHACMLSRYSPWLLRKGIGVRYKLSLRSSIGAVAISTDIQTPRVAVALLQVEWYRGCDFSRSSQCVLRRAFLYNWKLKTEEWIMNNEGILQNVFQSRNSAWYLFKMPLAFPNVIHYSVFNLQYSLIPGGIHYVSSRQRKTARGR